MDALGSLSFSGEVHQKKAAKTSDDEIVFVSQQKSDCKITFNP